MEIDWHRVAVSLNGAAHRDLVVSQQAGSAETAREFRMRGSILKSIADALFEGLEPMAPLL
jgi:hypothetical protein